MTVQYMRPYTVDELVALQQRVQEVFKDEPSFIAMTILAHELMCRLKPEDVTSPVPPSVAALTTALKSFVPLFIRCSTEGIETDEVPS